jgi:hypothetical protein
MSEQPWDRRPQSVSTRERDRLLVEWVTGEVIPFSPFWKERLSGLRFRGLESLGGVNVSDEVELAAAGGPGNPRLLLLPTEDQFKRHASRAELLAASRELRGGAEDARRAVLFRRYKPVHVHEAGVATVLAVAYTRSDLDRLHLAGARLCEVLGVGADDAMVNAVPAGPSVRFWGLYHAALAARMTALHPRVEGQDPVVAIARAFAMLPATVLAVPLADAEGLLAGLVARETLAPRLRTILTVGPAPTARQRERIIDAAGELGAAGEIRVQAVWAPETSRVLWGECRPPTGDPDEATYGFHTYPDLEVLEVRDPTDGLPVPDEQPGELVLTSLGWRGTALVRAATGTWTAGLVNHVPCPSCGRTVPRLAPEAVEGAWQPRVRIGDGRLRRVDLRRASSVLDDRRLAGVGVRDWSLRPVDGRLVLFVATEPGADAKPLAVELGGVLGVVPEVRVDPAGAAKRPQLGGAGVEPPSNVAPAEEVAARAAAQAQTPPPVAVAPPATAPAPAERPAAPRAARPPAPASPERRATSEPEPRPAAKRVTARPARPAARPPTASPPVAEPSATEAPVADTPPTAEPSAAARPPAQPATTPTPPPATEPAAERPARKMAKKAAARKAAKRTGRPAWGPRSSDDAEPEVPTVDTPRVRVLPATPAAESPTPPPPPPAGETDPDPDDSDAFDPFRPPEPEKEAPKSPSRPGAADPGEEDEEEWIRIRRPGSDG